MKNIDKIRETAIRTAQLSLLATLAACGSSSEENPCGAKNIGEAFVCALNDALGDSKPTEAPITGATVIVEFDEFEPNNSLDNANIVTIGAGRTDSSDGSEIQGNLTGADDTADYFIFTPNRSSTFNLFLCADTCAEIEQHDGVYIMIYDQNQTTIASTTVGSTATLQLDAELKSGLAYYVEIRGYDIGAESYAYRLVIAD